MVHEAGSIFSKMIVEDHHSSHERLLIRGVIDNEKALIIVRHTPLTLSFFNDNFLQNQEENENERETTNKSTNLNGELKLLTQNGIYYSFSIKTMANYTLQLIYPATEKEYNKYSPKEYQFVPEYIWDYTKNQPNINDDNWIANIVNALNGDINFGEKVQMEGDSISVINETKNKIFNASSNVDNQSDMPLAKKQKTNESATSEECENKEAQHEEEQNKESKNLVNVDCKRITKYVGDKKLFEEMIFYHDQNCCIIPNYHWNKKNVKNLYLLALFKDLKLRSIRDIKDINALKEVKKAVGCVLEKFGLKMNDTYMFFHYHPTYWFLHLHIVYAGFSGWFSKVGRAILLEDVIKNLEMDKIYYQKEIFVFKEKNE